MVEERNMTIDMDAYEEAKKMAQVCGLSRLDSISL